MGSSLVFSPDGLILVQADLSVKLWDVSSLKLIREMEYPDYGNTKAKNYATNVLFSPDGSLIAVSITNDSTHLGEPNGHLLVWDIITGELKQDWDQTYATMYTYNRYSPDPTIYNIPVDAMAFYPSSTKLVYANGNRIEIKDASSGEEITSWSLGKKMYASEMSIREDGEFLYILMKWYKNLTFPVLYRMKFVAQIWHPNSKSLRQETKFEEVYPSNAYMWLVGQNLIYEDITIPSFDAFDFSLENKKELPYRIGEKYFNIDGSLMLVFRNISYNEDKVSIEIWNTQTWRNIHTFYPNIEDYWFYARDFAFNSDNSLLAMYYDGQLSLWNIRPSIQP